MINKRIYFIIICIVCIVFFLLSPILFNKENSEEQIITIEEEIKKDEINESKEVTKEIKVDIKGEVKNPGVYSVKENTRVIEKTTTNMIQKINPIFTVNPLISKEI